MRAKPPELPPTSSPTQPPLLLSHHLLHSPPSNSPIDFSPPLIAMVVVAAAAFLLVNYSRLISRHLFPPFRRITLRYKRWRRRRLFRSHSDTDSLPPPYDSSHAFYVYSPYGLGLGESVIKNIPLQIYKPPPPTTTTANTATRGSNSSKLDLYDDFHDCAVCLLEFEDGDYMRTLPHCSHSFHADCIDMWLRAHATCPLCRAGAYDSPLAPLMAARIRPSLDEGIMLESSFLAPLPEQISGEIQQDRSQDLFSPERRTSQSDNHRFNRGELNVLLKRSHSFSFETSFAMTERVGVGVGAATTPHSRQRGLWMKKASSTPFRSIAKSRVFSSLRITKSPGGGFIRRRGYFPMSESWVSTRYSGGWSRRMRSSPIVTGRASSRMRMGDPEALISPERYGGGYGR